MLSIHLGAREGSKELLEELKDFCGDKITIQDYRLFYDIKIDTSLESGLNSLFQENHYLEKDYQLCIFKSMNHNEEVCIPLRLIDTIFSL